jgi:histidinol-phosphate aminotransferase
MADRSIAAPAAHDARGATTPAERRPYDLRHLPEPPIPAPLLPVGARVPHGGILPPGMPADAPVIDFSTSLNAWGPAQVVVDAAQRSVTAAALSHYPDPDARAPREAAAQAWGIDAARIVFGAGNSELLQAICQALLRAGDMVLVPTPTFGDYARVARLAGADVRELPPRDRVALDLDAVEAMLAEHEARLVIICSPNNPTGERLDPAHLARIADRCAITGTWLVLDQSYDAFLEHPAGVPLLGAHPAVLHLRSLTKEHALASVRAGFLIAPPHVIEAIDTVRAPWATSTLAQATAVACLGDEGAQHVAVTMARLRGERNRLVRECARLGLATYAGETHTLLIEVGDGDAARLALLRDAQVHVRSARSFGLPRHIRVSARTPAENDLLLAALGRLVAARR